MLLFTYKHIIYYIALLYYILYYTLLYYIYFLYCSACNTMQQKKSCFVILHHYKFAHSFCNKLNFVKNSCATVILLKKCLLVSNIPRLYIAINTLTVQKSVLKPFITLVFSKSCEQNYCEILPIGPFQVTNQNEQLNQIGVFGECWAPVDLTKCLMLK